VPIDALSKKSDKICPVSYGRNFATSLRQKSTSSSSKQLLLEIKSLTLRTEAESPHAIETSLPYNPTLPAIFSERIFKAVYGCFFASLTTIFNSFEKYFFIEVSSISLKRQIGEMSRSNFFS